MEVWRPGGRSEERRPPRHDRNRHRRPDRPADGAQPAAAGEAATGEPGDGAKRERHRHGRRDRHQDFRKPRPAAPADGATAAAPEGAPAREPREDKGRPSRERFEGKGRSEDRNKGKFRGDRDKGGRDNGGRDKGGRDKGGRDRDKGGRESGPSHRQYATSASPRERDRPIDPNSPFAKLAALKEQLTANRKDYSLSEACPGLDPVGTGSRQENASRKKTSPWVLLGAPASRQMVVARAGGESPHQRRRAGRGRPCSRQWRA